MTFEAETQQQRDHYVDILLELIETTRQPDEKPSKSSSISSISSAGSIKQAVAASVSINGLNPNLTSRSNQSPQGGPQPAGQQRASTSPVKSSGSPGQGQGSATKVLKSPSPLFHYIPLKL